MARQKNAMRPKFIFVNVNLQRVRNSCTERYLKCCKSNTGNAGLRFILVNAAGKNNSK
ncbi:MAG: hypothetical protein ACJARI_002166 [Bacteroidia bacterium]|jgi:hypothetical protein